MISDPHLMGGHLSHAEGAEAALRLVGALAQFWVIGSHPKGREWTTRALARGRSAPPLVLARALEGGATFAFIQGDHAMAALLAKEEVAFARKAQDRWRLAYAIGHMGFLALMRGAEEEAEGCMKESMPIALEVGDRWLIGRQLSNLGLIAWMRRDYQGACALLRQSVEISRTLNDQWFLSISLGNLAYVALRAEGGKAARELYREALLLCQHLGDRYGIGTNLTGMAGVEAEQGRADRAACLLGGAASGAGGGCQNWERRGKPSQSDCPRGAPLRRCLRRSLRPYSPDVRPLPEPERSEPRPHTRCRQRSRHVYTYHAS